MGCYNFLTGAAGFIQSIVYGYGGLRYREDGLYISPSVPKDTSYIKFRGIQYMGSVFDIVYDEKSTLWQVLLV